MKNYIIPLVLSVILMITACGGGYVAKVNDKKVTQSEFEFYLASVKSQMLGTELSDDSDWATIEIEGKPAIETAKERTFDTAIDNIAYIEVAKNQGVTLTDDDKEKIKQTKQNLVKNNGGDAKYNEYIKKNNITDSFIDMLCESMVYSQKLTEKVLEESPVTDEEIKNYFDENADSLNTEYRKAKHILRITKEMPNGPEYSAEKVEEVKKLSYELLERAKSGEDFDALMHEYSEDPGLAANPDGYVFTDNEMMQEFEAGVDALAPGEIGIAKTEAGYHIIKRLPLDLETFSDSIKEQLAAKKLKEKMDVWKTELKIERNDDIYNSIE